MSSEIKAAFLIFEANLFMAISACYALSVLIICHMMPCMAVILAEIQSGHIAVTRFYIILHRGVLHDRNEKQPRNHSFSG